MAGGSPDEWPEFSSADFDYFVGIDRGSLYIVERDWPLDLAVGDFDSLTMDEQQRIQEKAKELKRAQAEKDDTDTQLALGLAIQSFPESEIMLIGATGGRLDHFLANLWLPLEPRFQDFAHQIKVKDHQNSIAYYLPGEYVVKKEASMDYLAYCCLTPIKNLTLTKSKYTLDHVNVVIPTSYASNEFVGETATFSFDTGMIAVIQSRDK
ncbi:thiamine pyrophosphokinase [Enterococcus caccae]|nr:thiamine pyrophosphokinase [Enterococcus caccae]